MVQPDDYLPPADGEALSAASGLRVGNFQILGHFASGGTSQLWVALRDGAQEICLLKQLSAELATHETAERRLIREAQIAARLQHPNIGRVLSAGFEGGRFCLSTEFVPGQNVAAVMSKLFGSGETHVPPNIVLAIAASVLDGLHYIHELSDENAQPLDLVHRDLSPGNILISFSGEVKIIDFGTARAKIDDFRTAPGVVLGTPEYMSPEQAMAEPIDRRSDLYTFAVLLHEMLTGRALVPRDENLVAVLTAIRSTAPEPPSKYNPAVSTALDAVILKALAKLPIARWRNAAEMKGALLAAAAPLLPASVKEVSRFIRELMPAEEGRIEHLRLTGRRLAQAAEDQAGVSIVTRADPMQIEPNVELSVVTEIAPRRRTNSGAEFERTPVAAEKTAVIARATTAGRGRRPRTTSGETPAVLEMPGMPAVDISSAQLLHEAAHLRRSIRLWRAAFAGVAAFAIGAAAIGVALSRRDETPTKIEPAAAAAAAVPRGVASPEAAIEAPPDVPVAAAPARAETAAKKPVKRPRVEAPKEAAPKESAPVAAAPPQPAPAPAENRLSTLLRRLQAEPKDAKLFEQLHGEIRARAQKLPDDKRRLIISDLNAAERTYDIDLLSEALRKLNKQGG